MHPTDFARDVLKLTLWEKQNTVLNMVQEYDRVTVRSGHGVGKSVAAAALAVHFICEYDPALVLTTAPTFRQVYGVLWAEIRRMWWRTPFGKADIGQLNQTEIKLSDNRRAFGFSTDNPQRLQGLHCPNILVIVDEAGGVPDDIFDAIRGLLTSVNAKLLLIGNPIIPEGEFYQSHQPGSEFKQMIISALECPNVVEGREVIPGLSTRKWVEEQKREWGEDSPAYQARVLGEFPDSVEDALIPRLWAEAALKRGEGVILPLDKESLRFGIDVARFGADKTVFVIRDRHAVRYMEWYNGKDLMHTVGRTLTLAKEWGISEEAIAVDDTGMGGGVTDRLHELDLGVTPIDFGQRAMDREHFANMRAELHWNMRNALDPAKGATLAILPEHSVLCAEVIQSHYTFTSSAQIKIEPKDAIKKRLGRSPDHADALALTFAPLAPSMRIERL